MITQLEWEILEEIARLRTSRPWGAAVGEAYKGLRRAGYITATGKLTVLGSQIVNSGWASSSDGTWYHWVRWVSNYTDTWNVARDGVTKLIARPKA